MFIKYNTEQRLKDFSEKGEMYFNPAKKFREIEEMQGLKGQGDRHDSGLHSMSSTVVLKQPDGYSVIAHDIDNSILMASAGETPVFCLKSTNTEFITQAQYQEIKRQFPEYTHALIIDDESEFLENVRFSFKSRAFSHKVFYQNEYLLDFVEFMYSGDSNIRFYPIRKRGGSYYAHVQVERTDVKFKIDFFIDNSNYFRTMFRKDLFFQGQSEYRIVLPYERIKKGKIFRIKPFRARILSIESLIKENI